MAPATTYHEDSDADDEYERGLFSPQQAEFDQSPSASEHASTEPTPTHNKFDFAEEIMTGTPLPEWSSDRCADWLVSIGLSQYQNTFLENEVDGEALGALQHDELKEMGVSSMGHRLSILKSVYDIKMRQDLPIEPEDYVPLTADLDAEHMNAKQSDIQAIIRSIQMRDERIIQAELDLRRMTEEYKKLREELLPVFRMAKDRLHPLPPTSPSIASNVSAMPDHHGPPWAAEPEAETPSGSAFPAPLNSVSKRIEIGKPVQKRPLPSHLQLKENNKNPSPATIPTIPEDRSPINGNAGSHIPQSTLSTHLSTRPAPAQSGHRNTPSPTSPTYAPSTHSTIDSSYHSSRYSKYGAPTPSDTNTSISSHVAPPATTRNPTSSTLPISGPHNQSTLSLPDPPKSASTSSTPSDIFKSFRVSKEDPCYKVLPAALKRYNIDADPSSYALYIVHGDQERCLGREERPLLLFKKLAEEGRKPMFMLRKHNAPVHGYSTTTSHAGQGGVGGPPSQQASKTGLALPGGVI